MRRPVLRLSRNPAEYRTLMDKDVLDFNKWMDRQGMTPLAVP